MLRRVVATLVTGSPTASPACPPADPLIDFSTYQKRYVALELLYIGHNYGGFARQDNTQETIEVRRQERGGAGLAATPAVMAAAIAAGHLPGHCLARPRSLLAACGVAFDAGSGQSSASHAWLHACVPLPFCPAAGLPLLSAAPRAAGASRRRPGMARPSILEGRAHRQGRVG